MTRRFFGLAPFPKHHRRCALHFGILISRAYVARKLKPVAIGVKEINGLEYAVTCRANYINEIIRKANEAAIEFAAKQSSR